MQQRIKLAISALLLGSISTSGWANAELDALMKDDNQWATQRKDYAN